jgi:hypothetical protein
MVVMTQREYDAGCRLYTQQIDAVCRGWEKMQSEDAKAIFVEKDKLMKALTEAPSESGLEVLYNGGEYIYRGDYGGLSSLHIPVNGDCIVLTPKEEIRVINPVSLVRLTNLNLRLARKIMQKMGISSRSLKQRINYEGKKVSIYENSYNALAEGNPRTSFYLNLPRLEPRLAVDGKTYLSFALGNIQLEVHNRYVDPRNHSVEYQLRILPSKKHFEALEELALRKERCTDTGELEELSREWQKLGVRAFAWPQCSGLDYEIYNQWQKDRRQ